MESKHSHSIFLRCRLDCALSVTRLLSCNVTTLPSTSILKVKDGCATHCAVNPCITSVSGISKMLVSKNWISTFVTFSNERSRELNHCSLKADLGSILPAFEQKGPQHQGSKQGKRPHPKWAKPACITQSINNNNNTLQVCQPMLGTLGCNLVSTL